MINYVNALDIVNSRRQQSIDDKKWQPSLGIMIETVSSVSIDAYLKDEEHQPGYDYNPRNTGIDEAVIEWLEDNTKGNWTLDMCGRDIHFENTDDCWCFLEWLEEYEL